MFDASYFCPIHLPKLLPRLNPPNSLHKYSYNLTLISTLLFSFVFPVPAQLLSSIPVVPDLATHQNHWGTSLIYKFPGSTHPTTVEWELSGMEYGTLFSFFLSSPSGISIVSPLYITTFQGLLGPELVAISKVWARVVTFLILGIIILSM